MVNHLVHGYRQRILLAHHHHTETVADEQHVYLRLVHKQRGTVVVRGQHADLLAAPFHLEQRDCGNLLISHNKKPPEPSSEGASPCVSGTHCVSVLSAGKIQTPDLPDPSGTSALNEYGLQTNRSGIAFTRFPASLEQFSARFLEFLHR